MFECMASLHPGKVPWPPIRRRLPMTTHLEDLDLPAGVGMVRLVTTDDHTTIDIESYCDDPGGAFVRVLGDDQAAVDAAFERVSAALPSVLVAIWGAPSTAKERQ